MTPWKSLRVGGQAFDVCRVAAGEVPDMGDDKEGLTDLEKGQIWILDSLSDTRAMEVLAHEVCHALLDVSGAGFYIRQCLRKSVDGDQFEETVIRILAPHLSQLLEALTK